MLLGPALIGTLVGLATLSCMVIFLNMTSSPQLTNMHLFGGFSYPAFDPKLKDYTALAEYSREVFGLTAEVNPAETTQVKIQTRGKPMLNSNSSVIVETLNLDEAVYPQELKVAVEDTASNSTYNLQVFKSAVFPESITLSGLTDSGKQFFHCIPWGYLYWNTTVHLPALKNMNLSLAYSHYTMDLPWQMRSNSSFSTFFYPNMSAEQCFWHDDPLWHQLAFSQHSKGACWLGVQPLWSSCGQTSSQLTEAFLQRTGGANISAEFCVVSTSKQAESHSCKKMHTAMGTAAAFTVNTSDFLLLDGKDTKFFFNMDLSSTFGVVHTLASSWYQPKDGFAFTLRKRNMTETFHVVMGFANHVEVHGGVKVHGDSLMLNIKDSPTLANATVLELVVFSEDLDCFVKRLQLENGTNLESIPTPGKVCEQDQMADICQDGWKPTSTFVLPMSSWRPPNLQLRGQPSCRSLHDVEEPFDNNALTVSLHVRERETLSWIPSISGQELQAAATSEPCSSLPGRCVMDLRQAWDQLQNESLMHVTVVWRENCSFTWGPMLQITEDSDGFREEEPLAAHKEATSKELCTLPSLKESKLCGGTLESSTIQISLDTLTLSELQHHLRAPKIIASICKLFLLICFYKLSWLWCILYTSVYCAKDRGGPSQFEVSRHRFLH